MGYDPKQLHHLIRVEDYLERYINGESYANCLRPTNPEYLKAVKMGKYSLEDARIVADKTLAHIEEMCLPFTKESEFNVSNEKVDFVLDNAQLAIMKTAIMEELK